MVSTSQFITNHLKSGGTNMRMNEKLFWEIIDQSRQKANGVIDMHCPKVGWYGMRQPLIKKLSMLGVADIFTWSEILNLYRVLLFKTKVWAAGHVINGWCSDDGFGYFCNWLIAQGKDVVLNTLRDPEYLANLDTCEGRMQFEFLSYVPVEAYLMKLGIKDMNHFYDDYNKSRPLPEKIKEEITSGVVCADDIDIDLSKGDDLLNLLPKLCKKFKWKGLSKVYISTNPEGVHDGVYNMSIQLPNNGRDINDYSDDEIVEILTNGIRLECCTCYTN
jgi:hypothetical protein